MQPAKQPGTPATEHEPTAKPGDGIRSLQSSQLFRITNFELFVRPNKYIMTFGLVSITFCFGYLYYINQNQSNPTSPSYIAVSEDESLTIRKRTSRWD